MKLDCPKLLSFGPAGRCIIVKLNIELAIFDDLNIRTCGFSHTSNPSIFYRLNVQNIEDHLVYYIRNQSFLPTSMMFKQLFIPLRHENSIGSPSRSVMYSSKPGKLFSCQKPSLFSLPSPRTTTN